MNARGLFASIIALTAGCTVAGGSDEPGAGFRVEQIEVSADGLPYFVRGELGRVEAPIADVAGAPGALAAVLPAIADTLRVPAGDLVATRVERDSIGMTHVRLAQHKQGLRVVGGDVVLHVGADGAVRSVTSTARDRALTATPSLAAADAGRLAVQATTDARTDVKGSELVYVISTGDGELYLAWEILVFGTDALLIDYVYVDALTGRVVDRHPQVHTALNRVITNAGNQSFPAMGPQVGTEGSPPADPVAKAAYDNTGATYDCYKALFQRDSYNGAGATLTSTVHIVFPTPNGSTKNNAAWVNSPLAPPPRMVYGDGDDMLMTALARAYDVTAHELTHAVTSSTANLAYQNESGALNEGMSDIMAAVCEAWQDKAISRDTWLVGEDIFTPATAGDALRYMDNPTADKDLYPPALGGSRDFYADRYTGTADNGGVHLNSGIPNLAFYLLVSGGKHPRGRTTHTLPGIGMERAGAIFYRALTNGYFTTNTNLAQARTATEQAAQDLHPGCIKDVVGASWAAVGIGNQPPPDPTAPTLEITAPANLARVAPGFQVDANATDDRCVLKVELSIDGTVVKTAYAPPFSFTTDANLAPGVHSITVTTYDATNQTSDTITVNVGGACSADDQCTEGEICLSGTCQLDDSPGCGCATDDRRGAAGALALMLATAFALRRRRPRR